MKSKYACLSAALLLLGVPCRAQVPVEKPLGEYDKLVSQLKSSSLVGEPIRAGGTAIIPFASVTFAEGNITTVGNALNLGSLNPPRKDALRTEAEPKPPEGGKP